MTLRYHEPAADGVWRDGDLLVMDRNARLPMRCIRCNGPATTTVDLKLTWSPVHPLLRLSNSLYMNFVLRSTFGRSARVSVGLCRRHHARRRAAFAAAAACLAGALVALALASRMPVTALAALALLVAGLVVLALALRVVVPARIDDRYVRLKRVGRPFLEALPPLPANLWL